MKMSAQEEYGLRCLLRLGRQGASASLTLSELGRSEGISLANVAKMMRLLRRGFLDEEKDFAHTFPVKSVLQLPRISAIRGGLARILSARFSVQCFYNTLTHFVHDNRGRHLALYAVTGYFTK